MRCSGFLAAITVAVAAATPAAAATPRLGTPEVVTALTGEANMISAMSAPGHGDAYGVLHRKIGANVYSVVYRDVRGRVHRFDLPSTPGSFPYAIRLVALENGGGMALWDQGHANRVLARAWTRDGALGATAVVLTGVRTVHSAENDGPQWRVRGDGAGTVVVATTGDAPLDGAAVVAAVRDPGTRFHAQQVLTPPGETGVLQRQIRISAIAPDGSVVVAWGPEFGDGAGGRAVRSGRAATFSAPTAEPFSAERGLTAASRAAITAEGDPVTISAALARLCPCVSPHVFTWGARRVLVFQRYISPDSFEVGGWYVARAGAGGVFARARLATRGSFADPVRRERAGEIGFARFDTNTDNDLFRERSRLIVVPYGPDVPRSRRAPVLRFGPYARRRGRALMVPVYCDRVCGVHASSGRNGRLALTDDAGTRVDAALEPFTVAYLRVGLRGGRTKVRVSASAADDAGHRALLRATFVRGRDGRVVVWRPT